MTLGMILRDITAERDDLRAKLRAAEDDAARFRWLDEVALSVDMVADPDNQVQVWFDTVSGHPTTGRTLREAVDAAMRRHNAAGNRPAGGGSGFEVTRGRMAGGWVPVDADLVLTVDARLAALENWLEGDCTCPCCQGVLECVPGCTFAEDCPDEHERMAGARAALFGA